MRREIFLVLLLIFLLGIRFYFYNKEQPVYKNGDRVRVTSRVYSEPIRYDTSQYLKLQELKIYPPLYPEVSYGDVIVVEVVVEDERLKEPKLVSLEKPKAGVYNLRTKLIQTYQSSLPEPHASLVAGVTLGSKTGLPSDFLETLKNSGTVHVVVASGMNVTLVANFLVSALTIFMKRGKALVFALAGVWLYAILSGFDAPIIRAAIMGSIAFAAQELGKINITLRALTLTGFLMLFISPAYFKDLGFWLSFTATFSIVLLEPKIKFCLLKYRLFRAKNFVTKTVLMDLSTTLAAQVGVAPIIYYFFGQFNILSPVVNVLVLWTIVPITLIGIAGGLAGLALPFVGTLILWLAYPFSWWFVNIVNIFG